MRYGKVGRHIKRCPDFTDIRKPCLCPEGQHAMHTSASPALNTPILLIVFNRPNTTERVFEAICRQRPRQLFVAADGPRPHVDADAERCDAARKIATRVDWDCEVKTLFRKRNLECCVSLSSAITWFFSRLNTALFLRMTFCQLQIFSCFARNCC